LINGGLLPGDKHFEEQTSIYNLRILLQDILFVKTYFLRLSRAIFSG